MKKLVLGIVALTAGALMAKEFRFINGSTDWSDPASYSTDLWKDVPSDVLPGPDDSLQLIVHGEVSISSADEKSWAALNNIGRIRCYYADSYLAITVPSGTAEFATAVRSYDYSTRLNLYGHGGIRKYGEGCLNLMKTDKADYQCELDVRAGAVRYPQGIPGDEASLGKITVAEGATVFLPNFADGTARTTYALGFNGAGVITNELGNSSVRLCSTNGMHVYSGQLFPRIGLAVQAEQVFLSTNVHMRSLSVFGYDYFTYVYPEQFVSAVRIGRAGEASSIGTNGTISIGVNNSGGGIRYLGTGETTDKQLTIVYTQNRPAELSGGPNGGLVWEGTIAVNSYVPGWDRFVFSGDHTNECRLTGNMLGDSKGGTNYNFYVTKRGAGTWSFEGTKSITGGFAVEDGTLKFDSMDEAGKPSALGTATVLTKNVSKLLSDDIMVPYAYVLGATNAAGVTVGKGLLEYAGANSVRTTTRPAVMNGCGGFANNGTGSFRFAGVSALNETADNTLVLSGSGTAGNDVQDVAGPISVVKEGSGTWFLGGSNTFSGTVEVKEGTLWVRDPAKYTWYKWLIHETVSKSWQIQTAEFGLYDAQGSRVNGGIEEGGYSLQLAPGECGIGADMKTNIQSGSIPDFFDDTTSSCRMNLRPGMTDVGTVTADADKPETWYPIVMRLADGRADVATYDFTVFGTKEGLRANTPGIWSIEASADGIRWDEVVSVQTNLSFGSGEWGNYWRFTDKKYTDGGAAAHAGGAAIPGRKVSGVLPVLNNVDFVSVAPGATFKTDAGADLTLSKIRVDAGQAAADSVGTIENFKLAESGTLDVTGLGKDSPRAVTLPIAFVGVEDVQRIGDWTFTVDDAPTARWALSVSEDGKLTVTKSGLVLIVK